MRPIQLIMDFPVLPNLDVTVLKRQCMCWQELLNPSEKSLRPQGKLESEIILQAVIIRCNLLDKGKERFNLRSEKKAICVLRIVKWLNSETVSGAKKLFVTFIPNGECKHPPQMIHTVFSPLLVGPKNHFRVRRGSEIIHPKFFSKLNVVVYFTIVCNHQTRVRPHRLLARFKVDYT